MYLYSISSLSQCIKIVNEVKPTRNYHAMATAFNTVFYGSFGRSLIKDFVIFSGHFLVTKMFFPLFPLKNILLLHVRAGIYELYSRQYY